jgi:CCR4-NOT transcription complex subunit 7/8
MLLNLTTDSLGKSGLLESEEDEPLDSHLSKEGLRTGDHISEYDSSSENEESLSQGSVECDSRGEEEEELSVTTTTSSAIEIREVWSSNLYEEFMQICQLVREFPFVAMDTEFPGIVAKPVGNFSSMDEYKYQLVKCNVDLLKMIQLGVTLFDARGNRPPGVCTWQFNFRFSLTEDLYAEDSIDLLMSSGIQFHKHSTEGIEPAAFAEMLLVSGLVLMDNITWLTFHSAYDFGYLLSQLTCSSLPDSETEFLETLRLYFPNMYDIKYLMASTENLNGGLQKVANELRVKRIGHQHQAGSDSLLTGEVFFKMYEKYFHGGLDDMKYNGHICGLGASSGLIGGSGTVTGGLVLTPRKRHHLEEQGEDQLLWPSWKKSTSPW